ncbi:hypothetical protein ACIQPP_47070 [Streptomyces violaceusniger]|uniref:hypothetical protein n=1 Tax=Streptomyces violaceusniger TaxID=68280 RepID=UPI000996EEDD|nr:hypothetical protein [Streptomyces hygroscopicus]AQW49532.1 hypothetical protein SHXM_02995 [Streptomyces hygroscopicus]
MKWSVIGDLTAFVLDEFDRVESFAQEMDDACALERVPLGSTLGPAGVHGDRVVHASSLLHTADMASPRNQRAGHLAGK